MDVPRCWLTTGQTRGRRFNAMIHAVTEDVGEGVLDRFGDGPVDLGLSFLYLQMHLLITGHCQVVYQAMVLSPEAIDRLHLGLHHPLMQLRRDPVQPQTEINTG